MEELSIERKGSMVVAALLGEVTIDATPAIKRRLLDELEDGDYDGLVVDLSGTGFIDSSGIGFLVSLASRIENDDKSFYLYRPSAQVEKTLELVQLRTYFRILKTEDELAPLML